MPDQNPADKPIRIMAAIEEMIADLKEAKGIRRELADYHILTLQDLRSYYAARVKHDARPVDSGGPAQEQAKGQR